MIYLMDLRKQIGHQPFPMVMIFVFLDLSEEKKKNPDEKGNGNMDIKKEWMPPLMRCAETLYLVDDATKEILWCNEGNVGERCYEAFFDKTEPCSFCPHLKRDEVYKWDWYDKGNNRWLQIKNELFQDGERILRAGNFNEINDIMDLNRDSVNEISLLTKLLEENRKMKNELEYEATHDRMTGLLNRNCYNLDIASGMYHVPDIGVLYFDLNNLKKINDTYRHEAGDRLICRLAAAIQTVTEQVGNARCYRIGGDEFIMIRQGGTRQQLEQAVSAFRQLIAVTKEGEPPCVSAVGLAYSEAICDIEGLVFEADQEMYREKKRLKEKSFCRIY